MAPRLACGTIGVATPTDRRTEEGATVSPQSILQWVVFVTSHLLPSQSQTLAILVATAIRLERPNLAQIGRKMPGPATVTAAIQRAWRFTRNERIEVADARAGVIARLVRQRTKRLLVSVDGTEVRSFHTLMAAACLGGRAVPLVWASYPQGKLVRSQNSLEGGLPRLLRSLIPDSVEVVLLADRGFGRAEWAAVGRSGAGVGLHRADQARGDRRRPALPGRAQPVPGPQGDRARAAGRAVPQGCPGPALPHRDPLAAGVAPEAGRALVPDDRLEGRAEALCQLSGCRMQVEELFRDAKSQRNGWAVRHTKIQYADRFDRFLLILALAYLLLAGLGLQAKLDFEPSHWCTNTRNSECSVITIGKAMLARCNYDPEELLRRVRYATEDAATRWG